MISKETRGGHLHLKMCLDFGKQVLMSRFIYVNSALSKNPPFSHIP